MSVPICKFYLQGICRFGSKCRFSHSDDRGHRSKNQHYDEYRPQNNRQSYYGNDDNPKGTNYNDYDQYERNNYQSSDRNVNYHSKKDYYSKNNYNQRADNNYYEGDYNSSNNYDADYGSENRYQPKKDYNAKNYYKEQDYSEDRNTNSYHKYNKKSNYNDENNRETFTNNSYHPNSNRHNVTENHFNVKHNQAKASDRERKIKIFDNEIKSYCTRVKDTFETNIWPLTCFHPIGYEYAIQPVGCLNFPDVSFEEIRCDYYTSKSICASPELIHKQIVDNLVSKARTQIEHVVSLSDHVVDDLLATFEKCEQSKNNRDFMNSIQTDNNTYWDMSIKELKKPKNNKSEIDLFSFVSKNDNTDSKSAPTLKILMQNEVYGNMDCEAFAQENFTDYVPIMPPPRKYCF